jgi:hypothetical protein
MVAWLRELNAARIVAVARNDQVDELERLLGREANDGADVGGLEAQALLKVLRQDALLSPLFGAAAR